ncbi:MAG: type II toxin-antitoxin system Phd/YefM family antitoxin [Acidobacteria bacterium]|nr:type II toxin-antitoxin system Phd/YefM family antitoxin [Acidobacteriota bacterium]
MAITATALRQNVYQILDEVIETGKPVEVIRKGSVVKLVPQKKASKLSRLIKRKVYDGDPDEIIGMDWSKEWSELK